MFNIPKTISDSEIPISVRRTTKAQTPLRAKPNRSFFKELLRPNSGRKKPTGRCVNPIGFFIYASGKPVAFFFAETHFPLAP